MIIRSTYIQSKAEKIFVINDNFMKLGSTNEYH